MKDLGSFAEFDVDFVIADVVLRSLAFLLRYWSCHEGCDEDVKNADATGDDALNLPWYCSSKVNQSLLAREGLDTPLLS